MSAKIKRMMPAARPVPFVPVIPPKQKPPRAPNFALLDFEFLGAMAGVFQKGLDEGYGRNDWQRIEHNTENFDAYVAALMRHLSEAIAAHEKGTLSVEDHLAAVATNANILWKMQFRKKAD
jgi:hypothetical protein